MTTVLPDWISHSGLDTNTDEHTKPILEKMLNSLIVCNVI